MGTNSYYVGIDNSEVVIFQGRPGGFLWYQPKVEQRTQIAESAVPAEFQADVAKGKTEPSLQEAVAYVARMRAGIPTTAPPTTGTSLPAAGGTSTTAVPEAVAGNILGGAVSGGPVSTLPVSSTTTTTKP